MSVAPRKGGAKCQGSHQAAFGFLGQIKSYHEFRSGTRATSQTMGDFAAGGNFFGHMGQWMKQNM